MLNWPLQRIRESMRAKVIRAVEEVAARYHREQIEFHRDQMASFRTQIEEMSRQLAELREQLMARTDEQVERTIEFTRGAEIRSLRDLGFATQRLAVAETARFLTEAMPVAPSFAHPHATLEFGLSLAADQKGLALEFGVFSGTTLRIIANARNGENVFGFDSFEGLPEAWRSDFPAGSFAVETVPDVDGADLVVGSFEDTLQGFLEDHPEPVAFLHIDADLYSSAWTVLRHVGPRLVPGSVIVFDEFFNYPGWQEHEYRAWQRYVSEVGVRFRYEGYSRGDEQVVIRITDDQMSPTPSAIGE